MSVFNIHSAYNFRTQEKASSCGQTKLASEGARTMGALENPDMSLVQASSESTSKPKTTSVDAVRVP